jgi:hypothetical protein
MKKLISLLLFSLAITTVLAPSQGMAVGSRPLSDYGNAAIGELATCLRTSNRLDIFYLIDASKSLEGTNGTDPERKRKDIVAQDIKRWAEIAGFQKDLEVNVAGAFFNRTSIPLANWQRLTKNNSASVASSFSGKIDRQSLGNYTNWRVGLETAYNALDQRDASCKAVIWFTDGGLWPTSGDRLTTSLKELATLCGTSGVNAVPNSDSQKGLMSKIRRAGIHVYGILLVDPSIKTDDKNEPFYRSIMQPLIEEKGQLQKVPSNLSADMRCGENLEGEEKDYASGAFLEAASPAEVAFKFMKIVATVQDGTESECSKDGHFYVDPGIASIEFHTDATSWKIVDANNKVVKKSNKVVGGTTTRVTVPPLTESTDWKFIPSPSGGLCALFVFPELHLNLHDKALVGGRPSSITGQFLSSATSGEKADLTVFKSVSFSAKVDGFAQDADLNKAAASFEIKEYTPGKEAKSVSVSAKLNLETQHYILSPLELKQTKEVNAPALLPNVSKFVFDEPIYGSTGKATATSTVKVPEDKNHDSQVCFDAPEVIADNQDESSGAATNRNSSWDWKPVGLDAQNCLNILRGTNRDQTVSFQLTNPKQANSKGEALFGYRILTDGVDTIKDTSTADFETQEKRSGGMFWAILLLCLALGFGIPWLILWFLNKKNSVYAISGLMRAEIPVGYDSDFKRLVPVDGSSLDELQLPEQFKNIVSDKDVVTVFSDPSSAQVSRYGSNLNTSVVDFSAKPRIWPLSRPRFSATPKSGMFVAIKDQLFTNTPGPRRLSSNNLAKIAYFACASNDIESSARSGHQLVGTLVVFVTRPSMMSGAHFKGNVDQAIKDPAIGNAIFEALAFSRKNTKGNNPPDFGGNPGSGGGPVSPLDPLVPPAPTGGQDASAGFNTDLLKDI